MLDLTTYRTPAGVVIGTDTWKHLRASVTDAELAQALCLATEGMPMPDADITPKKAMTAFNDLRSTPLSKLLEPGRIRLLRSPESAQPSYHTRLKPPGRAASNFFFHTLRLRTPKMGAPSAWDKWHNNDMRLAVCRRFLHLKHVNRMDNATIRLALHMTGATPVQFKPGVAKAVYEITQAKRVLDLSMGWGDRLAGFCASSSTQHYTGIDPNLDLHPLYQQQTRMYGAGKAFAFFRAAAEDTPLPPGVFDLVFTSPPYFGMEKYGAGTPHENLQSWHKYPTPDQWRSNFLKPVIERSWASLQEGGVLAINIADISHQGVHYPLCRWLHEIVNPLPGAIFQFALGMRLQGANYSDQRREDVSGEPIWFWSKGPRDLPRALDGQKVDPTAPAPFALAPPKKRPPRTSPRPTVHTGHRGSPRTSPEDEAIVLAHHRAGLLGAPSIARLIKKSKPTIYNILRRHGLTPHKFTPRRKAAPKEKPPE